MFTPTYWVSPRFTPTGIVAILTVAVLCSRPASAQDPAKQERVLVDLRAPLDPMSGLSLFGPAVETIARTSGRGLHFTVPAGRANVGVLGVEWQRRLRGDFDVSVGYELIAVGEPVPRYGAGVSLRVWYDAPDALSTELTRSKRPEGERFGSVRIRKGNDGKEQFLNTKLIPAAGPKGRLRMVRAGTRLRFLAADGGDDREIQTLDIGSADVQKLQVICTTQNTPIALEACLTDLDIRADRILASWVEPEPRPGQPRLAFDLRTPIDQLSPLSLFGPTNDSIVATDARGLHFTLPASRSDTNPVGVELTKRLTGDFDVSFGYELLAVGGPLQQYGIALELKVWFDMPTPLCALLVRTRRTYGDRFVTLRVLEKPDGKEEFLDGKEVMARKPEGRLRLLRSGSKLHYLAWEGGAYRELQSFEIGTADVRLVRAQATTIWTPILLETRFTDLKVQADQIGEQTTRSELEPVAASEPEPARSRGRLIFLLAGAVMVLAVVFTALYLGRRRQLTAAVRPGGDAGERGGERVLVRCPHCHKRWSILAAKVGKEVKCPGCTAGFLPDTSAV